jgi:hypothetical protein
MWCAAREMASARRIAFFSEKLFVHLDLRLIGAIL